MKYDARACHFNMDTSCVELLLRDGTHPAIAIHDLILNGNPEEYLRNVAESHGLED